MKELENLKNALEAKGVIAALKLTIALVPLPEDCENPEEVTNDAIRECLEDTFERSEELRDLFVEFAAANAMNELIKSLDIQPTTKRVSGENLRKIKELAENLKSIVGGN